MTLPRFKTILYRPRIRLWAVLAPLSRLTLNFGASEAFLQAAILAQPGPGPPALGPECDRLPLHEPCSPLVERITRVLASKKVTRFSRTFRGRFYYLVEPSH